MPKSEVTGFMLAFLLGGLGAHRFYLRQPWRGVCYLGWCWTFIPSIVALCEAPFMPRRVRRFNAEGRL